MRRRTACRSRRTRGDLSGHNARRSAPRQGSFVLPLETDCTTICAVSHRFAAVPVTSVNRTCCPPGSIRGLSAYFTRLEIDEHLRCAAVRRNPHDALAVLGEDDAVGPPSHARGMAGWANRDGRTAGDSNSLERLIRGCVESDRSTIRRKDRVGHGQIALLCLESPSRPAPPSIGDTVGRSLHTPSARRPATWQAHGR